MQIIQIINEAQIGMGDYKKKNIIYVIENIAIRGGAERIISDKANILSAQYGHKITIISIYEDCRPASYPLNKDIDVVRLNVPMAVKNSNIVTKFFNRTATLLKAAKRLNKAIKSINPDIIFFTTTLSALLLPLCKTNARKIYESHSAKPFTPYNKLFLPMELCVDCVLCLTEGDAKEYRHSRKVMVIPNFISHPEKIVNDYSVKKAIAVGRLEYEKGFDILIECWKNIAKKHPDWHLDIYGEGSLSRELQQQIYSSGLKDKVMLRGRCDNMMEKYTEYSLHLMPSRHEGLPMTLIEAQACGLPSVTFNFNFGASDIIKDYHNGMIVEQGNVNLFVNAITEMMNNEKMRMEQGRKALENSRRFYAENIMPEWQKLIDGL